MIHTIQNQINGSQEIVEKIEEDSELEEENSAQQYIKSKYFKFQPNKDF